MKFIIGLLLFSTPVFAQYPKSDFYKTMDSINAILYKTMKVRYVNSEYDVFYLRKINANQNGNITVIDPLAIGYAKNNPIIFNLSQLSGFARKVNEIQAIDKNGQKVGAITNIEIQDMRELIEQFDALRNIYILYEKKNIKNK